ncbi:DUF4328 domain-containing protein [Haloferula chungangensis]|uniref:DUF4328 domain-containing protein n=1 Tax=Haloferula chungangensis TaxID=1048331 RepID=A0ABW2L226_9BACT
MSDQSQDPSLPETNPYQTPTSIPTPHVPSLAEGQGPYGPFINTHTLSRVVIGLVIASTVIEILMMLITAAELNVLKSDGSGSYLEGLTHQWIPLALSGSAILFLILYIATIVAFARWIIRSSKNAWLFSRQSNQFITTITPGWAVGYYFIPIINLWKPYTAMREIRDATDQGILRGVLPFWWTTWVASAILGQISFRLGNRADTIEKYISSSVFDLVVLPLSLALSVLAIILVRDITRAQLERNGSHRGSGAAETPAL